MSGGSCGQSSDRFADLWRAGEVELESSVSLADPNLTCPCLKVEGDLFVDLSGGVGRREYLDANFRRPSEAGLGICFLAAFRREPCDVDGFDAAQGLRPGTRSPRAHLVKIVLKGFPSCFAFCRVLVLGEDS